MVRHTKKVKNLFYSSVFFLSLSASSYNLENYSNEYFSGNNKVKESLENIEDNKWKISSTFDHSIFQVEQEAIFKINESNRIILLKAFRKTKAFGGFRREKQSFEINYDENLILYEYNRKKGSISFDCNDFEDCTFFDNLTLQLQAKLSSKSSEIPVELNFNYLDKGQIKTKVFKLENLNDLSLKNTDNIKLKFSEVRDDDKGFELWFDPSKNYLTYKIYQDFGSQDLTWNLKSKPSEE